MFGWKITVVQNVGYIAGKSRKYQVSKVLKGHGWHIFMRSFEIIIEKTK
jgi:hypothetical protein